MLLSKYSSRDYLASKVETCFDLQPLLLDRVLD